MKLEKKWIIHLRLPEKNEDFYFNQERITIGKGMDRDLRICDDYMICRNHAEIVFCNGVWCVTGLNKYIPVYLNQKVLQRESECGIPLSPGDIIQLSCKRSIVFVEARTLEDQDCIDSPEEKRSLFTKIRCLFGRKA